MKTLYERCIEPIMLYACRVWGHRVAATQVNARKVTAIQRLMLIRMTRAYRTVSHAALCAMTGIIPIAMKIDELLCRYDDMTKSNVEHRVPFTSFLHPAQPHRIAFKNLNAHTWPADTSIFTDGSHSTTGVGCAFVVFVHGIEIAMQHFTLHKNCSIFQAEMLAILKALEWLVSNGLLSAALVTDSLSSLMALQGKDMSHPLVHRVKSLLASNEVARSTLFYYTKAHAGMYGNERADLCAKWAATRTQPHSYSKEPVSSVKTTNRKRSWSRWQICWINETVGRHTFRFVSDVQQPLPLTLINYYTTQFFTGHGSFGDYLVRFRKRSSMTCYCGASSCTVDHILTECTSHGNHAIKQKYQHQQPHERSLRAIVDDMILSECFLQLSREHVQQAKTFFNDVH